MKLYKSPTNGNVSYFPISITADERGTRIILLRRITSKKKIKVFGLKIPYKKKLELEVIYFQPLKGTYAGKWLLLKDNCIEWNNLKVKHIVKSKNFINLLNVIKDTFSK